MRIGIVTLPFNWNYGGLLQNYALQWALKQLGHEPLTINRIDKMQPPLRQKLVLIGKRIILKFIFRKDISIRAWPKEQDLKILKQNTDSFIYENIDTTDLLNSEKDFGKIGKYNFEAFIAGSDQVWRPRYSPKIESHFLGFLNKNSNTKRISYAASFGADNWEFTARQTKRCGKLAKQFDAISVREDSGVRLCREFLDVDSQITLDPTFLVPKEEYIRLVEKDGIQEMPGKLFTYVLDASAEKKELIAEVGKRLNLVHFSSTANRSFFDVGRKRITECIYPPVTSWLRAFMDAEFVVTDSFHGTVFSIIFNKPFITLGNAKRGLARFESVLKIFDLESRLLTEYSVAEVDKVIDSKVDYKKVNEILEQQKGASIKFLKNALA